MSVVQLDPRRLEQQRARTHEKVVAAKTHSRHVRYIRIGLVLITLGALAFGVAYFGVLLARSQAEVWAPYIYHTFNKP